MRVLESLFQTVSYKEQMAECRKIANENKRENAIEHLNKKFETTNSFFKFVKHNNTKLQTKFNHKLRDFFKDETTSRMVYDCLVDCLMDEEFLCENNSSEIKSLSLNELFKLKQSMKVAETYIGYINKDVDYVNNAFVFKDILK